MLLPALTSVLLALPLACSASLASLIITIPASALLPSPQTLPPQTHAILSAANRTLTAPLDRKNRLHFAAIPPGSYLCDIACRDYTFHPLRVDVAEQGETTGEARGEAPAAASILVYTTFRGNEWANTGELLGRGGGGGGALEVEAKVQGRRPLYEERQGLGLASLLKNPMILIGVAGLALMVGMPKLMQSMDPETRKEFEETQKNNPLAGGLGGGNPLGGFDVAGWMAGSGGKDGAEEPAKSSGAEAGGGKARKRG